MRRIRTRIWRSPLTYGGVGLGLAHRRGAGWRGRFNSPVYTDEKAAQKAHAKILGDRLSVVKQRLDEINRSQKEE